MEKRQKDLNHFEDILSRDLSLCCQTFLSERV